MKLHVCSLQPHCNPVTSWLVKRLICAYLKVMNLREKIQKRISSLDDAVLPDLLKELDAFEKRSRGRERFSKEFLSSLTKVRDRNKG
jgi:hypothetical protein